MPSMNKSPDAIDQKVSSFLEYHRVAISEDMPHRGALRIAVALDDAFSAFVVKHGSIWNDTGPAYHGLLIALISRVYERTTGAILSYLTGAWAALENETRSTMESAVTVMFVCGDPILRLGQYFTSYFETAESQLNQHFNLVEGTAHQAGVIKGRDIATSHRDFVDRFCQECGIPFPATGWPKLIDRFTAVDEAVQYRHLYAVLSSAAHSDAGDVIGLMLRHVSRTLTPDLAPILDAEIPLHIQQFMYSAVKWYAKSVAAFAHCLDVKAELVAPIREAFEEANNSIAALGREFEVLAERAAAINTKLG